MNLKTTTQQAIELARIDANDNVELLGIQPLKEVSFELKCAVDNNIYCDKNTFRNVFGTDCYFFYALQQVRKNELIAAERGIGTLSIVDGKTLLKREFPIQDHEQNICQGGCVYFNCSDCDHIVATSSVPVKYVECLYEDNVLISSRTPFMPHIIRSSPHSIIARLDGDLDAISFKELLGDKEFQDELMALLKKYNKQIALGCSKLSTKKVQTSAIQFDKVDTSSVKKNTIALDGNELKFYDGESWHKILMEKI